jgi:hypothetical protein
MRRHLTVRLALPLAVVVTVLWPAGAHASSSGFGLTSNGYEVFVDGQRDHISVFVAKRKGPFAIAEYTAKGTVAPNRLRGSFGRFGRISVRFHPSSNRTWERRHRRCRGRSRFVTRDGVFVGRIDFTGEEGYVAVHSRRAKGSVRDVAAKCKRLSSRRRELRSIQLSPPSGLDELPFLTAGWREDVRSAQFVAAGNRFSIFGASTEESRGRVAIGRFALRLGSGGTRLTVNDALTFAKVSPPPPFGGTAIYRAGPDGVKSWTGSLRVDFPGAKDYPLTGPPFKARVEKFSSSFLPFISAMRSRLDRNRGSRPESPRWIESVFR